MELDSRIFARVLSPLAAFADDNDEEPAADDGPDAGPDDDDDDDVSWDRSSLNPRNRIDSLTPHARPRWRIDGVDTRGQRFFAVPLSAVGAAPLRIDVYMPPPEEYPRLLRELLRPEAALRAPGRDAVARLPVARYLLRVLDSWSRRTPGLEAEYGSAPFGSQIVVGSLAPDVHDVDVHLIPCYDTELCMETPEALRRMWKLSDEEAWPETIDLSELRFRRQLHEAITVVKIPQRQRPGEELVFKSLTRDQKYLYNELKVLLGLPQHPSIVPRPLYVVTKKCRFGGKEGVCGFVLPYYPLGTLQQRITDARHGAARPISLDQCLRWSRQITEALVHINRLPFGFYPDLKPDNIVLRRAPADNGNDGGNEDDREELLDAVLLDFEQRGGWFSWSPPEVVNVEYLEFLPDHITDPRLRREITDALDEYMPAWKRCSQTDRYRNVDGGFSRPWLALAREREREREQGHADGGRPRRGRLEKAQVFLLGKMLWCIFEGQPLVRCAVDHDVLQDDLCGSDLASWLPFPEFVRAPEHVRRLVRACTRGAPEWTGARRREIVLRRGRLEPAVWERRGAKGAMPSAQDTLEVARRWWTAELQGARRFMEGLLNGGSEPRGRNVLAEASLRPSLGDVLDELKRLEDLSGSDSSGSR